MSRARRSIAALVMAAVCSMVAIPASGSVYSDVVLADNPAGYWRLGEAAGPTASDETGASHGSYQGGVTLGQTGPLAADGDTAVAFDGSSGYVLVNDPGASPLDVTRLTMESWVKWDGTGGTNMVMNKESVWEMAVTSGTLASAISTTAHSWAWKSGGTVTANNWHHVAVTQDGSHIRHYVDGSEVYATPWGGNVRVNNQHLRLARRGSGTSYFHGVLDEAAVYGEALSPQQIVDHYNAATGWIADDSGNWSDTTKWSAGIVPSGAGKLGNFALVDITADRTVTVDSARTIGHLKFGDATASHNWTLDTSGNLTLADLPGGRPTIEVVNQQATIANALAGTQGLTKTGAGTLRLEGKLNYTGGTTVDEGTLVLGQSGLGWGTYGQFGSSHTLTVNPGATLDLQQSKVTGMGQAHQINVVGGTLDFSVDNYQSKIDLTGGHITTSGSGHPWRTGNVGDGLITVHASDVSSTIDGLLCFVKVGSGGKTTFDVADGTAAEDLVVSSTIYDHPGNYAGMELVKDGPGTMVLTGTSSFAGDVTVAEGVLVATSLADKGVACNLGAGDTVTLGSSGANGTLRLSTAGVSYTDRDFVLAAGGSGTVEVSEVMDIDGVVSGGGDFHKKGTNDPGNSGTRLSFGAANIYTGDTYIDEGVLQVSGSGTIPDTSDVHITGGAADGRLRLNHAEAINGLYGDGVVQTYAGNPQTLTIGAAGGDGSFSGTIEPGITLVKAGAGTQTLSGDLDHTGGTTVDGGMLVLNKAGVLTSGNTGQFGSSGHTVTVNDGATLRLTKHWVMGDGQQHHLEINGGTLDFGTDNYQSSVALTGGHVITSGGNYPWRTGNFADALITVNPSATSSTIQGSLTFVKRPSATTTTFDVANGAAADDLVVSAVINDHAPASTYGGMMLLKDGPGRMVLSGASTYIGPTTVAAGTLALSHATSSNIIPSSAVIDVQTGAVLDVTGLAGGAGLVLAGGQSLVGNGTVDGSVGVGLGATISAGASPGHLIITGDYTQDGTMLAQFAGYVQGEEYDWIDVDGSATLGGVVDVDLLSFSPAIGSTFDILTAEGGITNADLSAVAFDFADAETGMYWWRDIVSLGGDAEALRLTVSPEPATLTLFALGALGMLGRRRNRRAQ